MQNTTNYGLNKPEATEFYNIEVQNDNMDIIDGKMKEIENVSSEANEGIAEHIANKDNPHEVTKDDVGLGNVPNVGTNNQTPTYTVPTDMAELSSGEKLSVAFGKIAKAVKSLIEHLANTGNPHSVAKEQVGLSNCDNTSDMDKPVSTAQQAAINNAKTAATQNGTSNGVKALVTPWNISETHYKGYIRSNNTKVYRALANGGGDYPWESPTIWEEVMLSDIMEEHQKELDYIIEPWNKYVGYSVNNLCSHKGVVYKCISGNTNVEPPNSTYWEVAWVNRIIETIGKITTSTGEKVSLPSQTGTSATNLTSMTLNKGIYFVVCSGNFATNSTGFRRINLLQSTNTASASLGVTASSMAVQGITTSLQIQTVLNVTADNTTYYLNAQQNSGSTLDDCQGQIRAVRIA